MQCNAILPKISQRVVISEYVMNVMVLSSRCNELSVDARENFTYDWRF
jgi:hypothetical protein